MFIQIIICTNLQLVHNKYIYCMHVVGSFPWKNHIYNVDTDIHIWRKTASPHALCLAVTNWQEQRKKQLKQYFKFGIFLDLKEPIIIWLYNILSMNLPNACYYRYTSSSNYSDFLKCHLHLRNRLLDQGYQNNRFIRSL